MSTSTVVVGVDFVHRIQSEYPFLIATGNGVLIASRITGSP